MAPYDELISVLEAFMDQYPGALRIRGIKTALLIQKATATGQGITLSELARQTNTPLENVRRHIAKYAEQGYLRYVEDPNDERAIRVMFNRPNEEAKRAERVFEKLCAMDWPSSTDQAGIPEKRADQADKGK